MATYTKQSSSLAPSANITYGAATSTDDFVNGGQERLHVRNGGGGGITVTINSVKPCDQGADHDVVVSIAAGADRWIGPFPPDRFNDPVTNKVTVNYSGTTSVTVALLG